VTTGKQLIDLGRQMGLEESRQQGFEQGLEQSRREGRQRLQELLLHLLRQRFGDAVDAPVERRIAMASIEQIETWTRRVLSAATLGELFAN